MNGHSRGGRVFNALKVRVTRPPEEPCGVCGSRWPRVAADVITPELGDSWGLDEAWTDRFNEREGLLCLGCRSSRRSEQMARTLVDFARDNLSTRSNSLKGLVHDLAFRELAVAEMNSCGSLHRYLKELPSNSYSEYGSTDPQVPSEDLMNLSYPDGTFDLVLTSDTLEHVPHFETANSEIYRVLKPAGVHIFTVPIVFDGRPTRRRALLQDGVMTRLLPDSFHGRPGRTLPDFLVFYEFGSDVLDKVRSAGFAVEVRQDIHNPALLTIIARRPV